MRAADQHAARLAALETACLRNRHDLCKRSGPYYIYEQKSLPRFFAVTTSRHLRDRTASLTLERRMNIGDAARARSTKYILARLSRARVFSITGKNLNRRLVADRLRGPVGMGTTLPYVTAIYAADAGRSSLRRQWSPRATPQPTSTARPMPTPTATLSAEAYFWRGYDKYEAGDYAGAIAEYTTAIELDPADADAYYNRGLAKTWLDAHAGAIVDFTRGRSAVYLQALAAYEPFEAKYQSDEAIYLEARATYSAIIATPTIALATPAAIGFGYLRSGRISLPPQPPSLPAPPTRRYTQILFALHWKD